MSSTTPATSSDTPVVTSESVSSIAPAATTPAADQPSAGASSMRPRRSFGTKLFLGFLAAVACAYLGLLAYHYAVPPKSAEELAEDEERSLLELCRELCLKNGLLPTGHIANDAKALLKATGPEELRGGVFEILSDREFQVAASQEHALLGQPAPDFELLDHEGKPRTLKELANGRPVVLVFYYGYGCSHCVAQLFAIHRELRYFRELDAQVIALSDDAPDHTAKQYEKYGRFDFPVLSDPKNVVAEKYRVLKRSRPDGPEFLDHGTFVIDSEGKIVWAYQGTEPFYDNKSLLSLLASSRGVHPLGATLEKR